MKHSSITFVGRWGLIIAGLILCGCGESLTGSRYTLEMPPLPPAWEPLLGNPHWRVEWINEQGQWETTTIAGQDMLTISLPPAGVSAVSALPFWPDKGLLPGIFRPAGALFPFDAAGKNLVLSWQGGVDAYLFGELARAYGAAGQDEEETDAAQRASTRRLPLYFNWPRFRLLFDDTSVNEEVRADPWLADWHDIAYKTVLSGFDKRRLVPESRGSLRVPVNGGRWIGASPFAAPLVFDDVPVFPVRQTADTWVSSGGVLRCNRDTWLLIAEW